MADKPRDNKPASEFGEIKVIKNEKPRDPAGKTPGSAEGGGLDKGEGDRPGKTPGNAEG